MTVFLAISVSIIPPVVEVFDNERDRNTFAFNYKRDHGITLAVVMREVHANGPIPASKSNG